MSPLSLLLTSVLTLLPDLANAGSTLQTLGANVPGGTGIGHTWSNVICSFIPHCGVALPAGGGLEFVSLKFIKAVMLFIGGFAVVAVLYGAIRIITSAGNPERIKAGRQAILYGLGGLVLALISDEIFRWLSALLYAIAT